MIETSTLNQADGGNRNIEHPSLNTGSEDETPDQKSKYKASSQQEKMPFNETPIQRVTKLPPIRELLRECGIDDPTIGEIADETPFNETPFNEMPIQTVTKLPPLKELLKEWGMDNPTIGKTADETPFNETPVQKVTKLPPFRELLKECGIDDPTIGEIPLNEMPIQRVTKLPPLKELLREWGIDDPTIGEIPFNETPIQRFERLPPIREVFRDSCIGDATIWDTTMRSREPMGPPPCPRPHYASLAQDISPFDRNLRYQENEPRSQPQPPSHSSGEGIWSTCQ
ncbi:hypothetical protein GGR54DRAFT_610247 [Hypoxylon sp. NC1633]|nr:hypothetical protein GGR54DRAFT_610247 [Hypoxylon sp. NC1633]